jgi:ppGpp synthetase/RelA/SpoT-type nucleotidyltranferase
VPLPCSGRQLSKLGERLASDGQVSDADYGLLAQVTDAYQAVLDQVERRLGELGYQATTRVKTTGTLVDKLRRDTTLKLKSVHDFAGARIVIDGNRRDQDLATSRIVDEFASCAKAPVKKDRRETPSHGYRAVHVIVFPEDIPVEIQIRTEIQDVWAQLNEGLGDRWGRGLHYGAGPDQPDALAGTPFAPLLTRAQVVEAVAALSDMIDIGERLSLDVAGLREQAAAGAATEDAVAVLGGRLAELQAAMESITTSLVTLTEDVDSE